MEIGERHGDSSGKLFSKGWLCQRGLYRTTGGKQTRICLHLAWLEQGSVICSILK